MVIGDYVVMERYCNGIADMVVAKLSHLHEFGQRLSQFRKPVHAHIRSCDFNSRRGHGWDDVFRIEASPGCETLCFEFRCKGLVTRARSTKRVRDRSDVQARENSRRCEMS